MPRDTAPDSAHPAAGHQLAQAPGGAAPIGRVETIAGTVTAQHPDGTVETLSQGASVYQRDLIQTQADAKVALVFADKTTFALGESGQMRLDEMIYDPSHKDGKIALSMLKGAFAFVSGDVAATQADAMTVRTPVGTIGIRGTAVEGNVASDGTSTFSAVPDPSGAHSTVAFTNGAGTSILTDNTSITVQSFFTAPSAPFAIAGGELGALMAIASTIASTINPGGSTSPEGAAGPTAPQPGQAPQGIGDHTPLIHVSVSETDLSTGPEFVVTFDYQPLTPQYVPPPIPTYLTVPPSPTPSAEVTTQAVGFLGTLGVDHFTGTPAAELFNFAFVHNSLQSGDYVDGGGGNDTLTALFDKPFAIDSTLTIKNVPDIEITLGGGANTLDALNITVGPLDTTSTITVMGNGSLTVTDLQVSLDAHAMIDTLIATAIGSNLTIEGGAAANTLTGAGFGMGDVVSYQHAASAVDVSFAAGTGMHGSFTDSITGFDGVRGSAFDDNIDVSTGGGHSITVEGGGGNNTLTGSLSDIDFLSYAHAPGGATVDFTAGTANNGYGGTDVFSGFSGAIGSAFDDTFKTTDTTHTIIGGGGNDTVSVDGTINNLTLINIKDVVGINLGATGTNVTLAAPPSGFVVDLTASGGNDTVAVLGGNGGSISVGSGDDAIAVVGSSNTITAGVGGTGADDVLNVIGSSNTITVDPTGGSIGNLATVGVVGDSNTVTVGNGSDLISVTMTAIGSSNAITVGNGDDVIGVIGNSNTIHFGTGSDTISVSGDDNVLVDGAPLIRDVITIAGNSDQLFLSGGKDHITVAGADDLISITGGDDSISVGGGSVTVDFTTLGNDPISFVGNGGSAVLNFQGFADDVISMTGNGNAATINGGNATITINDSGAGNAVSALSDDLITVNMSGTNGSLSLNVNADANSIVLNGTAGTSELIAISGGGDSSLIAASGDDTISVGGGSDLLFIGVTSNSGPHSDAITLSGANDQLFVGSDDTVSASLSGSSDIINIFGDDAFVTMTASGSSATVDLVAGDDDLIAVQGSNATITVSMAGTSGPDTLAASGNDDVISVMGSSFTTYFVDASGTNDTFSVSASDDTIQVGGNGGENFAINVTGADDWIVVSGGDDTIAIGLAGTDDTITITGSEDFISLPASNETFMIDVNGCDDSITFSGSDDTITLSLGGVNNSVTISGHDDVLSVPGNFESFTIDISGAADTILLGGSDDTITVGGTGAADISASGFHEDVIVTALASSSIISFGDPANSTLTLDVAGSTTETVGSSTGSLELFTTTTGAGVSDLILENGSYHLTFDGSELNGGNMTVDGSQLGASSSLYLDVSAETSGPIDVHPGAGADTLMGNLRDTLDYSQSSQMVTLTLTNFVNGIAGGASGTGAGGSAAGDQFTNFGNLDASTVAGGELIIGASGSDTLITSITLGDSTVAGAIHEIGCAVSLSGFDSIANQSGIGLNIDGSNNNVTIAGGNENDTITAGAGDDVITIGSGSNSISVGGGDDVITITGTGGGTNTITVGANTTVAFQNANDSTQNNLNILQSWSDTNERIDLSTLTAQASIVNQGNPASFAAAFGADTAGELDYAVIGGNTYVHLASGPGYSTHDLLVEIAGTHSLTVTSPGVVHH